MDDMKILEAYTLISAFKENIPDKQNIEEKYLREYHAILDKIEISTQYDLNAFRIPEEESYCDRPILMTQVDAIVVMFAFLLPNSEKHSIDAIKIKEVATGLHNIERPIHQVFAVFSGLLGIANLLIAIALILDSEGSWILPLVITFISFLFIVPSVALFRGKNWGRLTLSFLFHGFMIGIVALIAFAAWIAIDDNQKDISFFLYYLGLCLIPLLIFIFLIVILHSKYLKEERIK